MRPTVEEQLQGTCRILETVVGPCVDDPFARTILANLIANLRMVTAALPKVGAFLRDDNAATLSQLVALRNAVPPELGARIDAAGAETRDADPAAAEARNAQLRALLAEALDGASLTPALRDGLETYMLDRASRAPMRYVPTVSATPRATARQ